MENENLENCNAKHLESLNETIAKRHFEYIKKHKTSPKYVKVPYWTYSVLLQKQVPIAVLELDNYPIRYMGLICCETVSISEISEIEVF